MLVPLALVLSSPPLQKKHRHRVSDANEWANECCYDSNSSGKNCTGSCAAWIERISRAERKKLRNRMMSWDSTINFNPRKWLLLVCVWVCLCVLESSRGVGGWKGKENQLMKSAVRTARHDLEAPNFTNPWLFKYLPMTREHCASTSSSSSYNFI